MRQCWTILAVLLLLLPAASCRKGKEIDRRISLRRRDKVPYGTKVAYEGLQSLFPNATVTDEDKPPALLQSGDGKIACIIVTVRMDPSPADINSILDFVGSGNHVFISARVFGDSLLHTLGLRAGNQFWLPPTAFGRPMDSLRISIRQPVTGDSLAFSYPGDSYEGWVESYDPKYAAVLGYDHLGRPNFVRFTYKGGGTLYLHFAPLAFSNFFLLHKHNISYYQDALSYLPASVQTVAWDGYYARKGYERESKNSFPVLSFIMRNPSLAAAFWLLLLLFLLIYLFESKRRQRNIPIIEPLRNTSLDFVKTIGRLYFQRRDNHNLASKMVAHFQDMVRTRYNLAATTLDDELVERLVLRTGYRKEELSRLVGYMRVLPSKAHVPDSELMDFHRQLEAFYKIA